MPRNYPAPTVEELLLLANEEATRIAEMSALSQADAARVIRAYMQSHTLKNCDFGMMPKISPAMLNALSEFTNNRTIKRLSFWENIGVEGVTALAPGIASSRALKELSFGNVNEDVVQSLAGALQENNTIDELSLYRTGEEAPISDDTAQDFAQALTGKKYKRITLTNLHFSAAGFEALMNALATNETLESIIITNCNIGDTGAQAWTTALGNLKWLRELNLSDNNIGDEGAKALAQAFLTMPTLTNVDLSGNRIADAGARAIASALSTQIQHADGALENVSHIEHLELPQNRIRDDGFEALAKLMDHNDTLTFLRVVANEFDSDGEQDFDEDDDYSFSRDENRKHFNAISAGTDRNQENRVNKAEQLHEELDELLQNEGDVKLRAKLANIMAEYVAGDDAPQRVNAPEEEGKMANEQDSVPQPPGGPAAMDTRDDDEDADVEQSRRNKPAR